MRDRLSVIVGAVVGLVLALSLAYLPPVDAARNASGTYSLPSGNPVVTGTSISSTWANTTLTDIGSEITASLDRNGKGAMLAPLELANGTLALPALSFDSDPDTGLYRIGANNLGISVGGVKVWDGTATSVTVPVGATVTQSASNGVAVTATGNGTGAGAVIAGGSSQTNVQSALTSTANAAGNGIGATLTGAGSGSGAVVLGGASQTNVQSSLVVTSHASGNAKAITASGAGSGVGLAVVGGATGAGMTATGGGTAVGATISNGTAAVAGTARTALAIASGDIAFTPAVNHTSTVGFTNKITPKNTVKAWGLIRTDGAGACSVVDGFNLTSCSAASATAINVTIADDMAGEDYGVVSGGGQNNVAGGSVSFWFHRNTTTAGVLVLTGYADNGAGFVSANPQTQALEFTVMLLGVQ